MKKYWSYIGKVTAFLILGAYIALKLIGNNELLLEKYKIVFYIIIGVAIVVTLFRPFKKK